MPELIGRRDYGGAHGPIFVGALRPGQAVVDVDPKAESHVVSYHYHVGSQSASIRMMPTTLRIAAARFMPLLVTSGLLAVGCFDTVQAQNLTLSTTSLSFSAAKGSNPPTQTVTTGSSGGSFNFTITTNQSWLSAATSVFTGATGTTGQTLTVQVTSSSLASGTYNGTITLTPDNSSSPANIAVTLTVAGSGNTAYTLSSSLANLYFAYQLNQTGP